MAGHRVRRREPGRSAGDSRKADGWIIAARAQRYPAPCSPICRDQMLRGLAKAGVEPPVGSVGDSYDNAVAETINGLYKSEVHRRGPWRNFKPSSSRPRNGSIDSTTAGSWSPSETFRRPSQEKWLREPCSGGSRLAVTPRNGPSGPAGLRKRGGLSS